MIEFHLNVTPLKTIYIDENELLIKSFRGVHVSTAISHQDIHECCTFQSRKKVLLLSNHFHQMLAEDYCTCAFLT